MNKNELKILIAGEGGQGVQALGKILSEAAFDNGLQVTFIPNYGVEQRGGVTIAFIKISRKEPIVYPKFSKADICVWLSERSVKRTQLYVDTKTKVIYNQGFITSAMKKNYQEVNFDQLGKELGSFRTVNMIVLGVLMKNLTEWFDFSKIKEIINEKFAKVYQKNPSLKELNTKALDVGYNL
jgi:2-oxoglutarate ferredoxin oxidoreductase subunit gamma